MKDASTAKKQTRERPTHLVLRVPPNTRIEGGTFDTIEVHNNLIEKVGQVALAKFGKPGTLARVEKLRAQIALGIETYLILVIKRDDRFFGYHAALTALHYGKPSTKILSIAPRYYGNLGLFSNLSVHCDVAIRSLLPRRPPSFNQS